MKKFLPVVLLLLITGCGEDQAVDIRSQNRLNMSKIRLGMTRDEVVNLMGDKSAKAGSGKNTVVVTNPYRTEIKRENGHTYEILYYYTHQDQGDWPFKRFQILERELTPIVLENGKVVDWGAKGQSHQQP